MPAPHPQPLVTPPGLRPGVLAVVVLAALACGEAQTDRAAWLRNTLVEDNRLLLERSPALTAGKMRKMALTPYNWFRGTMGQYLRDITRPESPFHAGSRFATVGSAGVQLVGDPHLENVGTYRCRDGRISVEFNDFDSAAYGPFYLDVWRLSLSIEVAMSMLVADAKALGKDGLLSILTDPARGREPVRAMAQGYFLEMRTIAAGGAAVRVEGDVGYGTIVDKLVEKAQEDGSVFEELDDYTRETPDGQREMFFGELDPPDAPGVFGDEVIGIPTRQQRLVESMVRDWATTLNDSTYAPPAARVVKGVSRRLGGGVSSYPLPRYYVLLEGPTASIDDDWLLEMREAPPKPPFPEVPGRAFPRFGSNGERVAVSQRTSHIRPDCDPLLGWAVDGSQSFRVRHRTKYQKGFGVDDLQEDLVEDEKWTLDDFTQFTFAIGRLLARVHALSPTLDGGRGAEAVAGALGEAEAAFVDEVDAFARDYGPRVLADHQLLNDLIAEHGPLLGWRP